MKSNKDIQEQDASLNNQGLVSDVPVETSVLTNEIEETSEENETIVEISASVAYNSIKDDVGSNNDDLTIDKLRLKIECKLKEIEASKQYISLCSILYKNNSLITEGEKRIFAIRRKIQYANKYIKDLSDNFLNVLTATGWFDKYYDAVCLFDRAHDSEESMEWCEAMKDSLATSIDDAKKEAPKIKVLINRYIANSVFTLSVKTPYLRLKESSLNDIMPFISIQSKLFYSWLKNIESLSLLLRNYWLELEFPSLKRDFYFENKDLNFEKAVGTTLLDYVNIYIDEKSNQGIDNSFFELIINEVDTFIEKMEDITSFYENQYEQNKKRIEYLTETLLNDYYKKDLEPIYGIYDGIMLSIDSLLSKFGKSEEREKWCSLLEGLSDVIIKFLSNQNINLSPKLTIGKSHIDNSKFEINNNPIDFFSFAKIATPTDASSEELKDCIASIRNYGFYHIDSDDNIKIIRETVVSVYN